MTDDATFERDLQAMLAARDPGPVPATLSDRVARRLAGERQPRWWRRIGRWTGTAAGLAGVAAAVVILAIVASRPIAPGPGAAPLPTPGLPYRIQPGDGTVSLEYVPAAQVIAGLLLFAGLFVVLLATRTRRIRIAAGVGILLVGATAFALGTSTSISADGGSSGVEPTAAGPAGTPGMWVSVRGDQPFTVFMTVTNTSPIPLRILGMPEPGSFLINGQTQPRLTGLALFGQCCDTSTLEPFRPVTLEPGGMVDLAIGGMAGACAIPADSASVGRYAGFTTIPIAYEQLSIRHDVAVELPRTAYVPSSDATCP